MPGVQSATVYPPWTGPHKLTTAPIGDAPEPDVVPTTDCLRAVLPLALAPPARPLVGGPVVGVALPGGVFPVPARALL
jgi:hypothetical protein